MRRTEPPACWPLPTVAELANRLGYRLEAAFARAFKRVIAMPPGAVKSEAMQVEHNEATENLRVHAPELEAAATHA
jgi:AraC-like DNA-binding protein